MKIGHNHTAVGHVIRVSLLVVSGV
jgi:hypothetical protein